MTRHYENKATQTVDIINELAKNGASAISVLIRHSQRHFTDDGAMEPYMRLTREGRDISFDFGRRLEANLNVHLFSSFIGRCIETAYLIDKGYTSKTGRRLPHTRNEFRLSPFYITDVDKVVTELEKGGDPVFLRDWFDRKFSERVIQDPVETADQISDFMIRQLDTGGTPALTLCVSHDWNLYPVREFKLGQSLETTGNVGYLEGIFYFIKQGKTYIMGMDANPVEFRKNE